MCKDTLVFALSCSNSPSFTYVLFWRDFSERFTLLYQSSRNVFKLGRIGRGKLSNGIWTLGMCALASHLPSLGPQFLIYLMRGTTIAFWSGFLWFTHLQQLDVQSHCKAAWIRGNHYPWGKTCTPLHAVFLSGSVSWSKKRPFYSILLHWPPPLICSLETCGSQT